MTKCTHSELYLWLKPFSLDFINLMFFVMAYIIKEHMAMVSNYLVDYLQRNRDTVLLQRDFFYLQQYLQSLGWKINAQKSDLSFSNVHSFGNVYDGHRSKVPPYKIWTL